MKFSREWVMPNSSTLTMAPAKRLVVSYYERRSISIDPFAQNCRFATHTNDINPNTGAQYHLDALDFLNLLKNRGILADIIIFDPPYSLRQVKECYEGVGRQFTVADSQKAVRWNEEKNIINQLLKIGGVVISFGWNSVGMGIERFYEPIEIMLLCHGGAHNDTIIKVERKIAYQENLFDSPSLPFDKNEVA
jgi:hypothetical protein